MERPVLLTVGGEARQVVEDAGAGEYAPAGNASALAAAVRRLAPQRDRLARMGQDGRAHVLKHFDRRALARDYLVLLQGVAGM
jgi:glycosyltransferase involved in cell wall biosynthesis